MTQNFQTAPIANRFLAFLIDMIIIGLIGGAFLLLSMGKSKEGAFVDEEKLSLADEWQFIATCEAIVNDPQRDIYLNSFIRNYKLELIVAIFLLPMIYYILFEGLWGATIGKLLTGIRVRRKDGGRISFLTAFIRFIGRNISALILMLGYILALFDRKHQALHDKIANTLVLKKGTGI